MRAREPLCEAVVFRIDDEIDVPLPVQRDILRTMPRDRRQARESGAGAADSTNSKPSVRMGFKFTWKSFLYCAR
jgi:hypothetical protein